MSIKDFFGEKTTLKVLSNQSLDTVAEDIESVEFLKKAAEDKDRFVPRVDFSKPENFVRFGSAEQYYEDAIKRIYTNYPYDGSKKEKVEWHLSSSYFDNYILENEYPRTNGFARFSPTGWGTQIESIGDYGATATASYEYIQVKGGPHKDTANTLLRDIYPSEGGTANIYEVSDNRESNLKFDLDNKGVTAEFWLQKDAFASSMFGLKTNKEVIFDLWNGEASSSAGYGRLTIELSGTSASESPFFLTVQSGTFGFYNQQIGASIQGTGSLSSFKHYAISLKNATGASSGIDVGFYINGEENYKATIGNTGINEVTGSLIANIGALRTAPSSSATVSFHGNAMEGWGKLSGSIDEFRYWKEKRSHKQIGRNWFTQVGAGTNKDKANTRLGVYYKFNEGIVGNSGTDSTVLDYSGRVSNGSWTGYGSNSRDLGSAIVLAGAATTEFKDPIIYASHPEVDDYLTRKTSEGKSYDTKNNSMIYHSMPDWIIQEDSDQGNLKKLTQIVSSYFDTLHLQIEAIPRIKQTLYASGSVSSSMKPLPFADKLLSSRGLIVPEIFGDATILEYFGDRDEDREFDFDLSRVKNTIYQNIYNNLTFLYKSKGTEKGIRNLIRCFGIDDELIKLNLYANDYTYTLENNYRQASVRNKYIDFNHQDRFGATVHQYAETGNANSVAFVSASLAQNFEEGLALTFETEVLFPEKFKEENIHFFDTPFITASLFGANTVNTSVDSTDTTTADTDVANFQVQALRREVESVDVKFQLTGTVGGYFPQLTSSFYGDTYNGERWVVAVRVSPTKHPNVGAVVTGSADDTYTINFYGVNALYGDVQNEFEVSNTITYAQGLDIVSNPKRFFAGAHRQNLTGTVLQQTDVKIGACRIWYDYIPNDVLRAHAIDPDNFGTQHPYRKAHLFENNLATRNISEAETLALNWTFETVTGSGPTGLFTVPDLSSGSALSQDRYGWVSKVLNSQHTGRGFGFPNSVTNAVDKNYVFAYKTQLPEVLTNDDTVKILERDDLQFTRETRPQNYYYAFEKSMYQEVSLDMLKMFSTVKDFNNLIGEPVNRYRQQYKDLSKLRELFFERVRNTPDFEKFVDFYKWFDDSLNVLLRQFLPASANVSDEIKTIIESHVLERNKYWTKFPTLETKDSEPQAGLRGINELTYNWRFGHAPISNNENESCFWWNQKAEREGVIGSGDSNVDADRKEIRSASLQVFDRKLTTPHRLGINKTTTIHGGVNFAENKRPYAFRSDLGPETSNSIDITIGDSPDCLDGIDANLAITRFGEKIKLPIKSTGGFASELASDGDTVAPFSVYSSSAGNTSLVVETSKEITNLHHDGYGDLREKPLQGPFTEKNVGGLQHRHIKLNPGTDTESTRPEGFRLKVASSTVSIMQPEKNSAGTIDRNLPVARRYRDETAKRPINVRNIVHSTASFVLGNYNALAEVVQTSNRRTNNAWWVKYHKDARTSVDAKHINFDKDSFKTVYSSSSPHVSGVLEYEKPQRGRHPHVIVERFSAPGGPETAGDALGGPGLDALSAEYSVYNTINYRNSVVRQFLNQELSYRSNQFGYHSSSAASPLVYHTHANSTASFHKINRNGVKRVRYASGFGFDNDPGNGSAFITSSQRDNGFVQRAIPGSDIQYAWITASAVSAPFGYATDARKNIKHEEMITFVSASEIGRYRSKQYNFGSLTADQGAFGASQAMVDTLQATPANGENASEFIPVDFVGLNTVVNEPITASQNLLGYDENVPVGSNLNSTEAYFNRDFVGLVKPEDKSAPTGHFPGAGAGLNSILNHRNGPYGYPMWKQTRTAQHALARHQRNNNLIDFLDPIDITFREINFGYGVTRIMPRISRHTTKKLIEPALSSKYKPLRHTLVADTTTNPAERQDRTFILKHTYANNLSYFGNRNLETSLVKLNGDPLTNDIRQIYNDVTDMYIRSSIDDEINPVSSFVSLRYRETIYPREYNTFLNRTRSRTNYDVGAILKWRETRTNRHQKSLVNSQGFAHTASMWPLDGRFDGTDFENADTHNAPFERPTPLASLGGLDGAGELLNDYTQFHNGTVRNIKPSALYARRDLTFHEGDGANSTEPTYGGDAKWQAAEQSGKKPFYDTYDAFADEIRRVGKDYSVVPEFRISDHIEFFLDEKGGDFNADILGQFSVLGGELSSSGQAQTIANSTEDRKFYHVYSTSDFLKFFDVIERDHKDVDDIGSAASIRLVCKAIKKFRPKEGFYPAQRGLQLATLFSKSYGPITKVTSSISTLADQSSFRTMLQPFYAPGIFFNTIKSGLAVDYPIFSKRHDKISENYQYSVNRFAKDPSEIFGFTSLKDFFKEDVAQYAYNFHRLSALSGANDGVGLMFDQRLPFESLIDPFSYLGSQTIADNEPHPSASIISSASFDGVPGVSYKLGISNFLAETINFYLDGGSLKFFASTDDNQSTFGQVESVVTTTGEVPKQYIMDVFIREGELTSDLTDGFTLSAPSSSINMYTNPSAFGPPVLIGDVALSGERLALGYAPYTPPYYDGWAKARITFAPTETKKFSAREIISSLKIDYSANAILNGKTGVFSTYRNYNDENSMRVSASINLRSVVRSKKAVYDEVGRVAGFEDDPSAGDRWVLQTKMETPILDFTHVSVAQPVSGSGSVPTGMWHQHGRMPPSSSQGVFFEVQDVPVSEISSAPATGSLIELVGFERASKRLGEVQRSKKVSEAVVAVPFVEGLAGEMEFLPINRSDINTALTLADGGASPDDFPPGSSIVNMVKKMRNYVFPPKMDFLTNETIDPFAMYIFEFTHTFSQQDLVDMWQNLSPSVGTSFETSTATIQHRILETELIGAQDLQSDNATGKLRWLVFKVKQKAEKNYFKKTLSSTDDNTLRSNLPGDRDEIPDYSFNWPYDYFSLVELVKMDAEIEYTNKGLDSEE
jgi:hypothetical protein